MALAYIHVILSTNWAMIYQNGYTSETHIPFPHVVAYRKYSSYSILWKNDITGKKGHSFAHLIQWLIHVVDNISTNA